MLKFLNISEKQDFEQFLVEAVLDCVQGPGFRVELTFGQDLQGSKNNLDTLSSVGLI